LLAIPTAAAIQILLRDWWSNRGPAAASESPVQPTVASTVESP